MVKCYLLRTVYSKLLTLHIFKMTQFKHMIKYKKHIVLKTKMFRYQNKRGFEATSLLRQYSLKARNRVSLLIDTFGTSCSLFSVTSKAPNSTAKTRPPIRMQNTPATLLSDRDLFPDVSYHNNIMIKITNHNETTKKTNIKG